MKKYQVLDEKENLEKIKIFSSDDAKLKILGELLSNKSSRDIIRLLIEKEMYTNEIAKKLELRVSLVIHHIQKMESIGLVEITNKKIIRKGEEHKFYRIPQGMLIIPNESEEGILKKILKDGVKILGVGAAITVSWIYSTFNEKIISTDTYEEEGITTNDPALLIVLYGVLAAIFAYTVIKNKKRG